MRRDLRITQVLHLYWRLGFLASPIFMTSSKFASILEPPPSRSIIVDFALHRPVKCLNIVSDTDVTDAEVVVTTT